MNSQSSPGRHAPTTSRSTAPLGPGTLTWELFGDQRSALLGGRTATLQAMHPGVGAVLWDSSNFRNEVVDRLMRSAAPIMGVIYDDPARATGIAVRDIHKGMVGTDTTGRHWHALKPELFYWVHATFVESMVATQQHFGTPLTRAQKDQLIAESPAYWDSYGVRAPREHWVDWADFEDYWNHTVEHDLERNKTTDFVFRNPMAMRDVPRNMAPLLWSALHRPTRRTLAWLTTGLLDDRTRDILELNWSNTDRRAFAATSAAVRHAWPLVPESRRYLPRAARGRARAQESR